MKLSVVTPTLNCREALKATAENVLAQTFADIEMVIVDGASTDGTFAAIEALAARHPERIRYASAPDTGVYQALNRGISMATGNIIASLHAGDLYTAPDIAARAVGALEAHPEAQFVYGDIHYYDPSDGHTVRRYRGGPDIARRLRRGIAPPHPTLFCRRSALEAAGPYDERYIIAGDFDMFLRLVFGLGMKGLYLPIDMVAMDNCGLSTRLRHRLWTNTAEKMRALRANHVSSTGLRALLRYFAQ